MLHGNKGRSPRFILVWSLFLVFLQTTSAERDTREISGNHEVTRNSAAERSDSSSMENPAEVISRSMEPSSEIHRKKRKAEVTNDSQSPPKAQSPRSSEPNNNKINQPQEMSEKITGKRSDALENEEEEDDEDEDIDEEASHQYKKRAGNERSLNLSSSGHRPPRQGPKIWDQWGKWSSCSVSCGAGKLTRWRHCIGGGCSLGEKEAQFKTCTFAAC